MRIPNAENVEIPYWVQQDHLLPELFSVHHLYSDEKYWCNLRRRQCDCANWEFVVTDTPGGYCKHLREIVQYLKRERRSHDRTRTVGHS